MRKLRITDKKTNEVKEFKWCMSYCGYEEQKNKDMHYVVRMLDANEESGCRCEHFMAKDVIVEYIED